MLLPLPTPEEMLRWDRETIKTIGIPGVTLMESASREAVSVLLDEYGPVEEKEIFCFAGSGNNGGDAFAMGRMLQDLGADVTVFHTKPTKHYRAEARSNLLWAQKLGVPLKHLDRVNFNILPQPDIVIDGLLGTGLRGHLRDDYITLIRNINRLAKHSYVLSIDIPSGLSGLNGQPQPEAIIADSTVTFEAPKLGLIMPEASRFTGILHVQSIGIPSLVQEKHPARHHLISDEIMNLIPTPELDMHKGKAGHILIIGGSPGLTGAPYLSAMGALRSGAGLVTIACPGGLADTIKAGNPDIMTLPLNKSDHWSQNLSEIILNKISHFDSIVIGPGLGRSRKTVDFLDAFIAECPARLVMDADALFGLAQLSEKMTKLPSDTILTPHPGEMATLFGVPNSKIQEERLGYAQKFTEISNATLVLKGAGTVVADQTMTCISPFSEPNLAVAGSGDVLSGIIGSLLARGLEPIEAASLGVYWHGMTGRILREKFPMRGNFASDIADSLPMAVKQYIEGVA